MNTDLVIISQYRMEGEQVARVEDVWPILIEREGLEAVKKLMNNYLAIQKVPQLREQLQPLYGNEQVVEAILNLGSYAHYKDHKCEKESEVKAILETL